jgi:hypothetical protein
MIEMQAKAESASDKRLQAQSDLRHWEKKLNEERERLKSAQEEAAVCEVEFQVRTNFRRLHT